MSSHNHTREAIKIDCSSECLGTEERSRHCREVLDGPRCLRTLRQTTINDIPDDVILEIFDFYLDDKNGIQRADKWHLLVHVCRRWRNVVFTSPRRLDLRLLCTGERSVGTMLDIWPALPIQMKYAYPERMTLQDGRLNNIIAALEHPNRVRHISIVGFPRSWEMLAGAMQVPFPELTYIRLWSHGIALSALPGGSTPRLRTLRLKGVPFLAVRDLILSASDLIDLTLSRSGYASPESIVACLSSLKRLKSLWLEIKLSQSRPDLPSSPLKARAVFPALTKFTFLGKSVCMGDFVAHIDTPMLTRLDLSFNRHPVFDTPHLRQFIGRTRAFKPSNTARVLFYSWSIRLESSPCHPELGIVWRATYLGIPSISPVVHQLSACFSLVERLDLVAKYDLRVRRRIESTVFLSVFRPFTTVRSLYVSKSLVPLIAPALQELIGETATEVLPNLRDLFLGGSEIPESSQEAIQKFVDARQLSGQPIAIHHWEEEEADR